MATPTPIDPVPVPIILDQTIQFDGTNALEVISFMEERAPDNLPVRGSVQLEPDPLAPNDPLVMMVELADGTIHTLTAGGPALQASAIQPVGPPIPIP